MPAQCLIALTKVALAARLIMPLILDVGSPGGATFAFAAPQGRPAATRTAPPTPPNQSHRKIRNAGEVIDAGHQVLNILDGLRVIFGPKPRIPNGAPPAEPGNAPAPTPAAPTPAAPTAPTPAAPTPSAASGRTDSNSGQAPGNAGGNGSPDGGGAVPAPSSGPLDTRLTILEPPVGHPGYPATINVRLSALDEFTHQPIATQEASNQPLVLVILINRKYSATTGSDGSGSFSFQLPENVRRGKEYSFRVFFNGSRELKRTSMYGRLMVPSE